MAKEMLTLEIDTEAARASADALIEVLDRLALAANMATEALEKLAAQSHGGIEIAIVGSLAKCTVAPSIAQN